MKGLLIAIMVLVAFAFASPLQAQAVWTVEFTWSPVLVDDLVYYRIYQSSVSPICVDDKVPVDLEPMVEIPVEEPMMQPTPFSWTEPDVAEGTHYYIITATDQSGNESLCSQEIALRLDVQPPEIIQGFEVVKVTAWIGSTPVPVTP